MTVHINKPLNPFKMAEMDPAALHPELTDADKVRQGYHDLSHKLSTTFSPGTINPIRAEECLPGDRFDYGHPGRIESFPMVAPCLDGFKYRVCSFFWKLQNAYGFWDNNTKITTDEFINKMDFWRYLPTPNRVPFFNLGHPLEGGSNKLAPDVATEGLSQSFWADPAFVAGIMLNGPAPGNLLNRLDQPIGAGPLVPPEEYHAIDVKGSGIEYENLKAGVINLHSLFAYMSAFRAALANNQEEYAYYIGCGIIEQSEYNGITLDVGSRRFLSYVYKRVSLRSLDMFLQGLRFYTSNPSYGPDGNALDLDLSSDAALVKFVEWMYPYMLRAQGYASVEAAGQNKFDCISALVYFLEVTGLLSRVPYMKGSYSGTTYTDPANYVLDGASKFTAALYTCHCPNAGMLLAPYEMDLNRGILSTSVGAVKSVVTVTDNGFTVDLLRFRNSVQKAIDKFDITGGRISSFLRRFWAVKPSKDFDQAELLHVCTTYIGNTDIIANAATDKADLAQQAGYSIGEIRENAYDTFATDDYGIFLSVAMFIPVVSYSQGIPENNFHRSLQDCFLEQYAGIGYQDVPEKYLYAQQAFNDSFFADNPSRLDQVVARRAAFQSYRASVDRANGNFGYGGPNSYWTLARIYSPLIVGSVLESPQEGATAVSCLKRTGSELNMTTYVFPRLYNYLFAQTDDSAQNFRAHLNCVLKGTRRVPAPQLPSL